MKRSIESQAQDHTERAVGVLAEIMDDWAEEAKDRIKAADILLDRGHGKPVAVSIQLPGGRTAAQLAGYTDEDLIAIIEQHQLPRLGQPSQERIEDAEFVPAGTTPSDEDLLS